MAVLKPFRGIRPRPELAKSIASRPYDVLDTREAREKAKGNPYSFLHVIKPEIDLPEDFDPYDQAVYEKGRDNFRQLIKEKVFFQDEQDCLYLYRLNMHGHQQTGLVGGAFIGDYFDNVIKKHELTRPDKELDRINHIKISGIQAEPVFFAYPSHPQLDQLLEEYPANHQPVYDFTASDGIIHQLWVISEPEIISKAVNWFGELDSVYVADGHHRTAAAALVGKELQENNPTHQGDEEYNFFMAVHFPDNQLKIIDYNRVVKDLNGLSKEDFIQRLRQSFEVEAQGKNIVKPGQLHEFGLYISNEWYRLTARSGTYEENDPIGVLDVTILSKQILEPVLGIHDLRRDKRIDFVGGIRGLKELEKRVDSGEMAVAFALYPVSMQQLIDIADSGSIMPPKTTWFEPKLRSGLVVHSF